MDDTSDSRETLKSKDVPRQRVEVKRAVNTGRGEQIRGDVDTVRQP
jgi:hypothetical protein